MRKQVQFAIAAAIAGFAWGYLRHRRHPRTAMLAALQGLEWFVAYGGAAAVIQAAQEWLEERDEPPLLEGAERITHLRQYVTEPTGTDG